MDYKLAIILGFLLIICKPKIEEVKTIEKPEPSPEPKINIQSSRPSAGECVGTTLIVEAKAGLRLREEPSLTAKVITTIPFENPVEFVEDTKVPIESEGKAGTFFKVSFESNEGYAFSEFLTYAREDETICGFQIKIRESNLETGNYFIGLTNSKQGDECNAMYAALDCFYLVFNSKNNLILDTRDINHKEPWKGWLNKYEIEIDASFGDDGCSFTKRYAFNIYNNTMRTLEKKEECHPIN